MRVWKAMLSIFLQQQVLHREFWLILILNAVLPVLVPLLAWMALSDSVGGLMIEGWTTDRFIQYYFLNFIVFTLAFSSIHTEIGTLVRTGQMSYWILRPLSFGEFAFSFSAARLLIMSLVCSFCALAFHMSGIVSFSLPQLGIAAAALPLAVALLIVIQILIGNLAFWLIECDGAFAAILLFLQFFGGLILPTDLFPEWLEPISNALPLRFAFSLPSAAIVQSDMSAILPILIGQMCWVFVLTFLAARLWKSGIRHYDAVGA